jgi:hypothetical protein
MVECIFVRHEPTSLFSGREPESQKTIRRIIECISMNSHLY